MQKTLTVGRPVEASPGDTFLFTPPSDTASYHFEVTAAVPSTVITVHRGNPTRGNSVARSKPYLPGKPSYPYVDHVLGDGNFTVTVGGMSSTYIIKVTANPSRFRAFLGYFGLKG